MVNYDIEMFCLKQREKEFQRKLSIMKAGNIPVDNNFVIRMKRQFNTERFCNELLKVSQKRIKA